jgi:F-type H+-transporting ATPase subunit c
MKKRIATIASFATAFLVPAVALAAPAAEGGGGGPSYVSAIFAIAMCLGIGIAAHGGGQGQGRAAAGALEGICRNPSATDKVFTPLLLSLAFVESLVIFTLVICFMVYGKMG